VRCTHGATVSRVDREELFYAMARGLSRGEAERLIVRGFFQDILDRIEFEAVRESLAAALEARIPPGVGLRAAPVDGPDLRGAIQ
jgi:Fe-S cluster assembly protein SufD